MRLTRNQLIFNAFFCITLLGVIVWALYAEYDRPWKEYQKKFVRLQQNITQKPGVRPGEEKIRQLWLRELGLVDRCITCHQGADKPGFENAPQPFKTHSGDYLRYHPIEKFGCIACHEGQGAALTVEAAHGKVRNWTKPILKGSFTQSSCGKCHFVEQSLPLSLDLAEASTFISGWRLFQEYNCIGCHKLSGYKRPDRIAPSLTSVGSKVKNDWLIEWLKNPKSYLPKTKMPRSNLNNEEINYIADYLMSLKSPPFNSPLTKGGYRGVKTVEDGENLVNSLGCLGCHKINGKGNDFAPDFSDIGNKVKPEWLYEFLKKPKSYDPKTIIPDFMIPENDIPGIVAYLMSLKSPPFNSPLAKGGHRGVDSPPDDRRISEPSEFLSESIAKGKKLVKDLGCTGCHEIEKLPSGQDAPDLDGIGNKRVDELAFGNIADIEKTLINWMEIKVMNPESFATDKIVTRMPNYDFSKEQTEALVTFLLSIKDKPVLRKYTKKLIDPDKPEMRGKKAFEKYNCLGCHKINKYGGDIGPDLTGEAKKSRPEWLFRFLKSPQKIRPLSIMKARMTNFNLSDKEVNSIIRYLAFVSKESYPYNFDLKREIYPEDIRSGEKLYQEIFACNGCHTVNGLGGEVGPEHTDLASRLNRKWLEQWLKDPQAIKPDVRMPRYEFKGWEFEALTNYLMTLGKYRFVQPKKMD